MEIKILGPGCYNCHELERTVFNAVAELDVTAEIDVIRDREQIATYGAAGVPALLINGKIKVYGRVPAIAEIRKWITEEL